MRALFVGGPVDNSELDIEADTPPTHYPPDTGGGQSRYRLQQVGRRGDEVVYAVYGAPDSADDDVIAIADERDYARRFDAEPERVGA